MKAMRRRHQRVVPLKEIADHVNRAVNLVKRQARFRGRRSRVLRLRSRVLLSSSVCPLPVSLARLNATECAETKYQLL
jgi:hypothetical protein